MDIGMDIGKLIEQLALEYAVQQGGGHKYAPLIEEGLHAFLPTLTQAAGGAEPEAVPPLHLSVGVLGQPPIAVVPLTQSTPITEDLAGHNPLFDETAPTAQGEPTS